MTKSVYIIGGAGSGKSTFTAQLLDELAMVTGPLEDLHTKPNAKGTPVTLRGHRFHTYNGTEGIYLGVIRDSFPGTDGLDRASSPTGEEWLRLGLAPKLIIAEGATLSSRRFLTALHEHTDLLLVHLHVDPFIADLRFLQRGSTQAPSFVTQTITRSANVLRDMEKLGCWISSVDTGNPDAWAVAQRSVLNHLQ